KGWRQGDIFRQPQLARTLERIEASPDDFYTGAMAREIAEFVEKGGGIITTEDLANYEVRDRTPLHGVYRGLEIISAPPPSSGGTALIEALNILEGFDLAKAGMDSSKSIHLITEAYRRAFLDRAQLMGDPEFVKVAVTTTINDEYGSRVTLGPLGFLLNNEMDDFTSKVGVPNLYGLVQGQANAVGPNRRPLSAMAPTIVLKDGKLWLVLGAEGGPT